MTKANGMDRETVEKMSSVQAIKVFFARKDSFSPNGQEIKTADFTGLSKEAREEIAALARAELIDPSCAVY